MKESSNQELIKKATSVVKSKTSSKKEIKLPKAPLRIP